jgi:hypothetical protein
MVTTFPESAWLQALPPKLFKSKIVAKKIKIENFIVIIWQRANLNVIEVM